MRTGTALMGLLALATPVPAEAQDIRVGAVQTWPDHALLGAPLGISVSAGWRAYPVIGVRIGYEAAWDEFSSFGSTCVGLIPPEGIKECGGEPRQESATLSAWEISVPLTVLQRDRLRLEVAPGFRLAHLNSDQTGEETGRRRSARKDMSGFDAGIDLLIQPLSSNLLTIFLGAHTTMFNRYQEEQIADGYTPFEEDVSVTRVTLGLSLRRWWLPLEANR